MRLAKFRNGFLRMGRQVQIIERLSSREAQVLASEVVPRCFTNLVGSDCEREIGYGGEVPGVAG